MRPTAVGHPSSTTRPGLRIAALFAAAALLLGGCADQRAERSPSAHSPTPSATPSSGAPSSTASPAARHRPYSDVNPPPRRAADFVVKVLELMRHDPPAPGRARHPARQGRQYWAEEVRTCVTRSAGRNEVVGRGDWRAEAVDGRLYPVDVEGSRGSRTPPYPLRRVLAPGECVTGWWWVSLPRRTEIRAFDFAPGGGRTLIEWLTLR